MLNGAIAKNLLNMIGKDKVAGILTDMLKGQLKTDTGEKVHIMLYENADEVFYQKYIFNPDSTKYIPFGERQNLANLITQIVNADE